MKKNQKTRARLFTLAALLVVLMLNLSPGWGQGISTPEDLVWVTPDISRGPALFYNNDSIFVCTAMGAKKVELRNSMDGTLIRKSEELDYSIDKLFLSPDNKFIAVLLDQDSEIKTAFYVLDAESLEIKFKYIKENSSQTYDLIFSNNSSKLYRLGNYKNGAELEVFDTETFKIVKDTLLNVNCLYLDLHPDNDFLAIGLLNGIIEFRDPESLSLKRTYTFKEDGQIYWMQLSPDGKLLAIKFQPPGNVKDYILNVQDFTLRDFSYSAFIGTKFSKDSKFILQNFDGNKSDTSFCVKRIIDNVPIYYYNSRHFLKKYQLGCYDISHDNQYFLSQIDNNIGKIKFIPNLTDVNLTELGTIDTIKPNPGTNNIEIILSKDIIINKIEIANESGQGIYSGFKIIENIPGKILLDISGLNNGMYFLNLISTNSVLSKKLIVMR